MSDVIAVSLILAVVIMLASSAFAFTGLFVAGIVSVWRNYDLDNVSSPISSGQIIGWLLVFVYACAIVVLWSLPGWLLGSHSG